ncbi:BA75_01195T0 [Komagataella pastoris]|uniref:BA75_01195T0 n=1 Tax=Komagataella pastoris TaxID=4922 RepID=A0A1B2J847_PICPA|nr:BA75_01195T0 [Komagataella pastoris]
MEKKESTITGVFDEEHSSNFISETGEIKKVKRGLEERHVAMIALGGTIGTGLFIGISTPLKNAGPVNALIAYIYMASLAFSVTQSLGELATHSPIAGSFCTFNTRYLSNALGFSTNWCYWFTWAITFAIELSIVGQIIEYWTYAVPIGAWIAIFFVILIGTNLFPVSFYGELEFWIASIKVIAIIGFILYAFIMVCGAGQTGPVGFRYWRNPGPWGPGILVSNVNTGRFLGWLSSLINAAFTYQGVELTGISAGEAANPRRAVPRAINKVIYRILIFYLLTLFFIGLLVPYNDPALNSTENFISSSPFLISIQNSGTKVLPDIFNAVILMTVISAGNSNIYIGSRILYSMGDSGNAPKCFLWVTKWGTPYVGVLFTGLFGLLAFLNLSEDGATVFDWLVNITAVAGLIAWMFISVSHIRFMHILRRRGSSRDELPYKAKWMPWFAWYAAINIFVILFIQGFEAFFDFTATKFFTAYISLILFVVLWIGSQFTLYRKDPWLIPIDEVDIDSEKRKVDEEVWEEEPPRTLWGKIWQTIL